jgi:hypothetical protein
VTFRIEVDDPDFIYGESVTLTLISNVSGILSTVGSDGEVVVDVTGLAPGMHRVSAIVSDGNASARSDTTIMVVGPPEGQPLQEPMEEAWIVLAMLLTIMALLVSGFLAGRFMRRR